MSSLSSLAEYKLSFVCISSSVRAQIYKNGFLGSGRVMAFERMLNDHITAVLKTSVLSYILPVRNAHRDTVNDVDDDDVDHVRSSDTHRRQVFVRQVCLLPLMCWSCIN